MTRIVHLTWLYESYRLGSKSKRKGWPGYPFHSTQSGKNVALSRYRCVFV